LVAGMLASRRTPVLAALRQSTGQAARAMCAFGSTARSRQQIPMLPRQLAASAINCAISVQKYSYATSIRSIPKSPQCPTCGAAFQTENSGAPGYLNEQKWRQMNQANVVKGLPEIEGTSESGSTEIPGLVNAKARKRSSNNANMLSDEEYKSIVSEIDDPELQAVFSGEKISGFVDPNDMQTGEPKVYSESEQGAKIDSFDTLLAARVRRRAEQGRDRVICQRCYSLKHYSRVDRPWKEDVVSDPRVLRFLQHKSNTMIVVVCDLFDIPGSLIPHLGDIIGARHPVVLVANKVDLLPKDYHEQRLLMWFKRFAKGLELNIQAIHLVSALKNLGVRELAADLTTRRRPGQNIYMVGRANVGKSELINALLRISIGGSAHKVLASHIPGTTMGLSGIPLRRFVKALVPSSGAQSHDRQSYLYDTPGVFSNKSIISYLTNEELKLAVCRKRIKPFSFILGLDQSLMLGGLGRIDLVEGPSRIFVTIYSNIRPHFTRIKRADDLVERMQAGEKTILQPPVGDAERLKWFPRQELALEHEFEGLHKQHATIDVVFAGIGW
ncbi:nitric oxide associated protein 1, partial [Coemansia sp. RSA 2523]